MKKFLRNLLAEIIKDILVSLPVKYLLRFMSVSKSWHSLINEPVFALLNFKHQSLHNSVLLTYCSPMYCPRPQIVEYLEDQKLTPRELNWPFEVEVTHRISMEFQCGGIVLCIVSDYRGLLFLWNPLLNKYKILPDLELDFNWRWKVLGFGYVSTINDYKIVILAITYFSKAIMVLNLKSRTWRKVCDQYSQFNTSDHWKMYTDSAALNGGLYFLVYLKLIKGFISFPRLTLSRFDLTEETVREQSLPSTINKDEIGHLSLKLIKGFLYLCHLDKRGQLYHFDMWVMKEEGCWHKFLYTPLYDFKEPQLVPLHFTRDGDLVIDSGAGRAFIIKDVENGSCRKIEVCEDNRWSNNRKLIVHQQSLISP